MLVKPEAPYRTMREFVASAGKPPKPLFSGYGNASSRGPAMLARAKVERR